MRSLTPGLGAGGDWAELLKRSSFGPAALLLAPAERADLALFYAYCRAIDDCADEFAPREALTHLGRWDEELKRVGRGRPQSDLGRGLAELCVRRRIPLSLLRDLRLGARSDARASVRFQTWGQLRRYCYQVAGSVGLCCLPIFGIEVEAGRAYAVALGEAFQIINILRDAAEDAGHGRLYFAREDLRRYGLAEAEFLAGKGGARARRLFEEYAVRVRQALARADEGARGLQPKGLRPSRLMRAVYGDLFEVMQADGFRVFERRYVISAWRKRWLVLRALVTS